jgi:hypothetical protein
MQNANLIPFRAQQQFWTAVPPRAQVVGQRPTTVSPSVCTANHCIRSLADRPRQPKVGQFTKALCEPESHGWEDAGWREHVHHKLITAI